MPVSHLDMPILSYLLKTFEHFMSSDFWTFYVTIFHFLIDL